MPIFTESSTRFWGEGSETILKWATDGGEGVFFERIFDGCFNDEEELEKLSNSYRLVNMVCQARKNYDGSVSLLMNTIRTIPVGAFERIARLFPSLHADGIFIFETEEFFGSYIIENGQFLWTQFHNPGIRSHELRRFDSFFEEYIESIGDETQQAVLKVLELERRELRGDKKATSEMKKLLGLFKDERSRKASIDFYFSKTEKKALCGDSSSQYKLYEDIDSREYYKDGFIYEHDDIENEVYYSDWELMQHSWLHKAAFNGHPDAQFQMVHYCLDKNALGEAKEWFKASLLNGCKEAIEEGLGIIQEYTEDEETTFIDDEIISFVESFANEKSIGAIKSLVDYYAYINEYHDNIYKEKEEYWRKKAVEVGEESALEGLAGFYYRNGKGTKEEVDKAINLYGQAMEKGSAWAMFSLARIYESRNEKGDLEKAIDLYKRASENGSSAAAFELAKKYALGKDVEKDILKSFGFLEKSYMNDNDTPAVVYMFLCIEKGERLFKSRIKKTDLQKVIEICPDYMLAIAKSYNDEDEMAGAFGIQKDGKKYVYWLRKVEEDDGTAKYRLGTLYYEGLLVRRNYKKAFEHFIRHAYFEDIDSRDDYSEYYLGLMYENGHYVPKNIFMAKKWFEKAANASDEDSIEALKRVESIIEADNLKPNEESISAAEFFENGVYKMCDEWYRGALEDLKQIGDYNDTQQRILKCLGELDISVDEWNSHNEDIYRQAMTALNNKYYKDAAELFSSIIGWKDSSKKIELVTEMANNETYEEALKLIEDNDLEGATEKLNSILDWRDSKEILNNIEKYAYEMLIKKANDYIEKRKYKKARADLLVAKDIIKYAKKDMEMIENDILYSEAFIAFDKGNFDKAIELLGNLNEWRDSKDRLAETIEIRQEWKYNRSLYFMDNRQYEEAKKLLSEIIDWKDSKQLLEECDSRINE